LERVGSVACAWCVPALLCLRVVDRGVGVASLVDSPSVATVLVFSTNCHSRNSYSTALCATVSVVDAQLPVSWLAKSLPQRVVTHG
jgi:hypothetical protein